MLTPTSPSPIGTLVISEVYEYYDGPRLFLASNAFDQSFLAVHADSDEDVETWLYAPVSPVRLQRVRSGQIDLHDAFSRAENGVWRVRGTSDAAELTWVSAETLDDQLLPDRGERLSVAELAQSPQNAVAQLARSSRRDVVEAHITVTGGNPNEAPVRLVGAFLEALQETADAIGQLVFDTFTPRGRISGQVLQKTRLLALATKPGSFTITMGGAWLPDVFGETSTSVVLEKLEHLLSATHNPGDLRGELLALKSRAVAKYRTVLEILDTYDAGLDIYWGSPLRPSTVTSITSSVARSALIVVKAAERDLAERKTIIGVLKAMDVTRSRKFKIVDQADGKKISGTVLDAAMSGAASAAMNLHYRATLVIVREVSSSGARKERFYLEDLEAITG